MSLACEHVDVDAECEWVFVCVFDSGNNMNCNHFHNAISSFVRLLVVLFRHFVAVLNTTIQTKRAKWIKKDKKNTRHAFIQFTCIVCIVVRYVETAEIKQNIHCNFIVSNIFCDALPSKCIHKNTKTILPSWKHDNKTNELWIKQKSLHRTQI